MVEDLEELSFEDCQHCFDFAHVCQVGRNCQNKDVFHWEKTIHIIRPNCPDGIQCKKLIHEDHLNSYTHSNIRDIRLLCIDGNKCSYRHNSDHLARYRHGFSARDSGVVRYYNLNKGINFVENQQKNIERVINYVKKKNWKILSSQSISPDIIDWIRTVQPVHRCKRDIFQSILLHGHVMSRDYMENLKKPGYVIHSILQHTRIQQIKHLRIKTYNDRAREYITALVTEVFKTNSTNKSTTGNEPPSPDIYNPQFDEQSIASIEVSLLKIITAEDLQIIKSTAIEIATSSIELQLKPSGIGYERDKDLGTNRTVFSILGPHSGQYGDIFIIFKREILHHPDANFSIQSATSYASGKAFIWRPWLRPDPMTDKDRIELFHKTKLHVAISGYEYATALELIAVTNPNEGEKTININLETLLNGWKNLESHRRIEAHLPQLIPLDYIQHVYTTKSIFDSFDANKQETIRTTFENNLSVVSFQSREQYEELVSKELITKFGQRDTPSLSRPIQGSVITIPSTDFRDHYVLPLTISQALTQYKIDHSNISNDITMYIYWQVMNGDMMLTLSNEQIDPNKQQETLKCLICYLAEKPSTKDASYHEQASYLHNGLPFQHYIFINERKYAAESTAFYLGCNTDDLMTFCLEIQRSTGKVILSHAGPNMIYTQQTISYTFSKETVNLADLEYIHVSAGVHTVLIRNLSVTFEKESKPLNNSDTTTENVQSDQVYDNIRNQPHRNVSTAFSPSNIVQRSIQNSGYNINEDTPASQNDSPGNLTPQSLNNSERHDEALAKDDLDEEWFKLHRNGNNGSSRLHEWTIFDRPPCIKEENYPASKTKSTATTVNSKMCGSMFGMAIGDALGAHVESRPHSYLVEHPVRDLQGGGTWGLEKGQWTDDTSMGLCLAISLIVRQGFDAYDQLVRYKWWWKYGYMTSTGRCFDIDHATSQSLGQFVDKQEVFIKKYNIRRESIDSLTTEQSKKFHNDFSTQCSEKGVAGNGALMRLAPLPLFFFRSPRDAIYYAGESALLTHGDIKARDACRYYAALICGAMIDHSKRDLLDNKFYHSCLEKKWFGDDQLVPEIKAIAEGSFKKKGYEAGIRRKGYIVMALEAALWAFWDSNSFEDGALKAVNLGDDTDTTAAIYGQLAGAVYGVERLPERWVDQLYARNYIEWLAKWLNYRGNEWYCKNHKT
ncbi:unnamed protein product [Didymodactylos carnosus]|uniref:ADP-ribosylglycohydrolase n=1 Tax=Didymodactylos carnosus TaxID=1234261 RepID=A0A8S2CYQ1_9BILA|nr:unnamed protein product [Didymodactylos carnosus]CAF3551996.1 unnamed protein product [Didymodactylos carnosus]